MAFQPVNLNETTAKNTSCSIERLLNGDRPRLPVPVPVPRLETASTAQENPLNNPHQGPTPPLTVYPFPSFPAPAATGIEALGARTGKAAFFEAREQNRMALDALRSSTCRPASSVHALCNAEEPGNKPNSFSFGPAAPQAAELPEELPFFNEATEWAFMSRPSYVPEEISSPGNFGLASAVVGPSLGSPVSSSGDVEVGSHHGMAIPRMADSTYQPSAGEGKKRKADAISETNLEEEKWAAKSAKVLSPAPSADGITVATRPQSPVMDEIIVATKPSTGLLTENTPPAEEEAAQVREKHVLDQVIKDSPGLAVEKSEAPSASAVAHASAVPERPAKRARMMRVAERIGYAALGGVTAGAMIVGTLIYTAPTFS